MSIYSIVLCCLSLCSNNEPPEYTPFAAYAVQSDYSSYSDQSLSQALLQDHNHISSGTFCSIDAIQIWKEEVYDLAQYDVLEQDAVKQGFAVPRIE